MGDQQQPGAVDAQDEAAAGRAAEEEDDAFLKRGAARTWD